MAAAADPRAAPSTSGAIVELAIGCLTLRPLEPGDRAQYWRFCMRLKPEDVRLRFGRMMRLTDALCDRLLGIDHIGEEAIAAFDEAGAILGVIRVVFAAGGEVAIIVRSDLKHQGIGDALIRHMLRVCRERGLAETVGYVMDENWPMLNLARKHGGRPAGPRSADLVEMHIPTTDPAQFLAAAGAQPSGFSRKDLTASN